MKDFTKITQYTSPVINQSQIRLIEAEAFRNGTQNTPIENALAETEAVFGEKREQVRRVCADTIKNLEGKREVARNRRTEAELRWQMWREMTGNIAPLLANPVGKIAAGFAAMTGEAVLLAPLMDFFGVADYTFQFILAGVIVIVLALLCELPIFLWRNNFNRYAIYAVSSINGFGMIALGVFRAFGLKTIEAKNSPLISGFLQENSLLSAFVIAFLTAGLPVAAAFAFETGWHGLSRFRQWRRARRDALKYAEREEILDKNLQGETEKMDKQIAALEEMRERWQSAQRQAHAEGLQTGARRRPFWEIAFLLFGGCVLLLALTMALAYIFCDAVLNAVIHSDLGRFALYLGIAAGVMSVFAYYVLKRWNSPTAAQLYEDYTVVFCNVEQNRPLSEGEERMTLELTHNNQPRKAEKASANGHGNWRI